MTLKNLFLGEGISQRQLFKRRLWPSALALLLFFSLVPAAQADGGMIWQNSGLISGVNSPMRFQCSRIASPSAVGSTCARTSSGEEASSTTSRPSKGRLRSA